MYQIKLQLKETALEYVMSAPEAYQFLTCAPHNFYYSILINAAVYTTCMLLHPCKCKGVFFF